MDFCKNSYFIVIPYRELTYSQIKNNLAKIFEMVSNGEEIIVSKNKGKERDPFDRLIIWQAVSQQRTLISKDKEFRKYAKHGLSILW